MDQTLVISVRPMPHGWAVQADTLLSGLLFLSGAAAEAAARALAACYARIGQASEVVVFLRDGALAGRFLFLP